MAASVVVMTIAPRTPGAAVSFALPPPYSWETPVRRIAQGHLVSQDQPEPAWDPGFPQPCHYSQFSFVAERAAGRLSLGAWRSADLCACLSTLLSDL